VPPWRQVPSARCLSPAPSAVDAPAPTVPACLTTQEALHLQNFALYCFPRLLLFSQKRLAAREWAPRLLRQPYVRSDDDVKFIFNFFSYSIFIVLALLKSFLFVVLGACARLIYPQDSHDYYAF
jgi:hypothetical protein